MNTGNNFLNTLPEPYVIIMVAPPLFGKSTLINEWLLLYNGVVNIISRDTILLRECNTTDYAEAWKIANHKAIDAILLQSIIDAAKNNENVIIDMTNLSAKTRKHRLSFFKNNYYKIAVVLTPPIYEELLERNKKRNIEENKYIPEKVIFDMFNNFGPIEENEKFDKIIYI
jgi:predicted kinase